MAQERWSDYTPLTGPYQDYSSRTPQGLPILGTFSEVTWRLSVRIPADRASHVIATPPSSRGLLLGPRAGRWLPVCCGRPSWPVHTRVVPPRIRRCKMRRVRDLWAPTIVLIALVGREGHGLAGPQQVMRHWNCRGSRFASDRVLRPFTLRFWTDCSSRSKPRLTSTTSKASNFSEDEDFAGSQARQVELERSGA